MAAGLAEIGFGVVDCQGTYFITADIAALAGNEDDVAFCRRITEKARVAAVPVSAFYLDDEQRRFIRFCFSKKDAVLEEALDRLRRYFA